MADVWGVEAALLSGCYVVAAAAAAAGQLRAGAAPAVPPGAPLPRGAKRTRRGKGRRRPGQPNNGDDDRDDSGDDLATGTDGTASTAPSQLSRATSYGSATTDSAASFRSCLSASHSPSSASFDTAPTSAISRRGRRANGNSNRNAVDDPYAAAPTQLCPLDRDCPNVNDAEHFTAFRHTCRLRMCPSVNDPLHLRYFDHDRSTTVAPLSPASSFSITSPPSTSASPRGGRGGRSQQPSSRQQQQQHVIIAHRDATTCWSGDDDEFPASAAVTSDATTSGCGGGGGTAGRIHADLRPNAPRSRPITVLWHDADAHSSAPPTSATVHGEWGRVRVHTLKQYLAQVTGIPPARQRVRAVASAAASSAASSPPNDHLDSPTAAAAAAHMKGPMARGRSRASPACGPSDPMAGQRGRGTGGRGCMDGSGGVSPRTVELDDDFAMVSVALRQLSPGSAALLPELWVAVLPPPAPLPQ